jgi:hypothetical protein
MTCCNNDPSLIEPIAGAGKCQGGQLGAEGAMNLNSLVAAVLLILALAGCAQVPTSQGPAPYAPYSRDSGADMRGGGDGGGGGGGGGM